MEAVCRCDRIVVHEPSMPAEYEILQAHLKNRYTECEITVMYAAGFQCFWLHDLLEDDGIKCIVTSANKVKKAKYERVKTDRRSSSGEKH